MPKIISTYGLTALILFLTSFFIDGNLDVAFHDSYVVISSTYIFIGFGLIFLFFTLVTWGLYKMSRRLSSTLNWFHYVLTVIGLLIIIVLIRKLTILPSTYNDYSILDELGEYEYWTLINEWLAITVMVLILSQLLFLANIIRAFIVKKKSQ